MYTQRAVWCAMLALSCLAATMSRRTRAQPAETTAVAVQPPHVRAADTGPENQMLTSVHLLHVKTLRGIFFSQADRAAILSQDGKTISTTELAARLERCAGYLGGPHGSPAGLPRYSPGF
eukprot:COSAG06_NODE_1210_length_10251_cov_8.941588_8_plen_120_part_00